MIGWMGDWVKRSFGVSVNPINLQNI